MRRATSILTALALVGCGGGGGGGSAPAASPARLVVGDVEFAPAATAADLPVTLAPTSTPPVLIQLAIELPTAVTVGPEPALQPSQPLTTLRGERVGNRYLVVCGDDRNPEGQRLVPGELFRLQLVTSTPRQVGTHALSLTDLIAADNDGSAAAVDGNPRVATVTVR